MVGIGPAYGVGVLAIMEGTVVRKVLELTEEVKGRCAVDSVAAILLLYSVV